MYTSMLHIAHGWSPSPAGLEALFYSLMDLLLAGIPQLDVVTPYCLVCGDPTAPSFFSSPKNAVIPPAQAGQAPWSLSLKGHAQAMVFKAANGAGEMVMGGERKKRLHHSDQ